MNELKSIITPTGIYVGYLVGENDEYITLRCGLKLNQYNMIYELPNDLTKDELTFFKKNVLSIDEVNIDTDNITNAIKQIYGE